MAKFDLSRWFAGIGGRGEVGAAGNAEYALVADARVRQAVDTLPVTLFEFDASGTYTAVAGRQVKLFGIGGSELIGRSVFDFPKFVPGKNMMVRRALAGESVVFSGIWPLGRFMIRLEPRFDEQRRVVAVVGLGFEFGKPVTSDSELQTLLEALRTSEARFRAMCDCAPLGIYVSNSKFELGYVNPALCALLGRSPEELLGRHWETVLPAEERERLRMAYATRGTEAYDGVLRIVRKDGAEVWTSLRLAEMRDDAELLGYVGAVADITPERSARLAADRAQHDLRRVIESSPEGIAVVRGRRFIFTNRALVEALGYARFEDLIGRAADEIVHPEDRARAFALVAEPATQPDRSALELRYRKASGEYAWMEIRAAALSEFEGAPALLLIARDITERKRLQTHLLVTERLLSVGTLAAGVAHEVNNPLAAALSNLDWVAARIAKLSREVPAGDALENSALRAELLRLEAPIIEAREAAERVRVIVRDLKLFSRAEEDSQGPVQLSGVLDSAARMAWNEARHRARLVRDYGELPLVHGSEARLGQVFLNLIINAAQAIPEGHADEHEIRLSARALPSQQVVVKVSDTGCGIAEDVLGRIFDPFFTTKPPSVGTGLGLSICHRIVTGMGGQIEVESQLGRGSEFRVTLQTVAPGAASVAARPERLTPAPNAPSAPPPPAAARGRVLVVDDDRAMAKAIGLVLADEHEVEVCTSARGALSRLRAGAHFDAVVCDVMMPEMSGMDFHSELAALRPELAPRVIFLTAGAFTLHAREFLDRITNPRLDKPFDAERLLGLVNRQVRSALARC